MAAAVVPERIAEMSPSARARWAAVFFLITIISGIIAQAVISGRLVVPGDASATARRILAEESLYRLGFSVYLIEMAAQVTMTALFYDLLKPVNKPLGQLSAAFSYIGCGIKTLSRLFYFAPLLVLGGAGYLSAFSDAQREALAMLFLKVNDQTAAIGLVFFGFHTVLRGYLVIKSTFLPRWLGVLSMIGGFGWLTFLSPSLGTKAFPIVALIGLVGALATITWLLVFGVNEERWREQFRMSQASMWR